MFVKLARHNIQISTRNAIGEEGDLFDAYNDAFEEWPKNDVYVIGNTTDIELEKQNFAHTGKALACVWNNFEIDSDPVVAQYVEPGAPLPDYGDIDENFKQIHVFENRLLPPSIRYVTGSKGPAPANPASDEGYFALLEKRILLQRFDPRSDKYPVLLCDYYCPSLKKNGKFEKMVSNDCDVYFATQVARKMHHCAEIVNNDAEDYDDKEFRFEETGSLDIPYI